MNRLDQAGWIFTYIGANQNAIHEANSMGIRNVLQYDSDEEGTKAMWNKERNSRKAFYERAKTIKSRSQLKRGYFDKVSMRSVVSRSWSLLKKMMKPY